MPLPVTIDVADLTSTVPEGATHEAPRGRIAQPTDPCGQGRCLRQFRGRGDEAARA